MTESTAHIVQIIPAPPGTVARWHKPANREGFIVRNVLAWALLQSGQVVGLYHDFRSASPELVLASDHKPDPKAGSFYDYFYFRPSLEDPA